MWFIEIAVVLLLLILLNGFFAMSELAVVNSRRGRLEQLAAEGKGVRAPPWLWPTIPGAFWPACRSE